MTITISNHSNQTTGSKNATTNILLDTSSQVLDQHRRGKQQQQPQQMASLARNNPTITNSKVTAKPKLEDLDESVELGRFYDDSTQVSKLPDQLRGQVDSFDHVTFWVGNAKHSAVFYMTQFGFEPFAFRGLETGSRDFACHVVKLNDTIIQFVSAVEPNNKQINDFLLSHGDAVKDVAFRVTDIDSLLKHALKEGAELVHPLETITFNFERDNGAEAQGQDGGLGKCVLKRATIKTFGDVTHTFIERNYEYERAKFLPGYKQPSLEVCSALATPL